MSSTRRTAAPCPTAGARRQAGFTLVELMVALVIGLVVAIAAVASLVVARNGFTSVDTTAQLRENARFATDLMQRIIVQAGYEDASQNVINKKMAVIAHGEDPEPDIIGWNNAVFTSTTFPPDTTNNSRNSACGGVSDSSCANGSDVLVVRYQGMNGPDGVTADGSMINCAGIAEPAAPVTGNTESRAYSVFHVARSSTSGEPTLMCSYRSAAGAWVTVPMVSGVESFQVLYGTDEVVPSVALSASAAAIPSSVPDRYLRADQLLVAGNPSATRANWRRVRSVRVGLVLRGPVSSRMLRTAGTTWPYYPFGTPTTDAAKSMYILSSSQDPGTQMNILEDGRMRLDGLTTTVYLHNRLSTD
jgi:type IV pilus assembly protein PilW